MDITIKPEQIDQFVRDAVLQSAIGTVIQKAIQNAMSGYNNPVDEQVKHFIGRIAHEIVEAEYRTVVEEAVRKHLAEKVNEQLVENVTAKLCEKMTSNSY